MEKKKIPLREVSISRIFIDGDKATYEIPIYQRNYAWEKDEISTLIQDVYDAYKKDAGKVYYIGTLVSFYKGDQIYEIIDGQQRLTTIRLILGVFGITPHNELTYRARRKSSNTIKAIPEFNDKEKDYDFGIENGFKYAKAAYGDIVPKDEAEGFKKYFIENVHIIHYRVPRDIDLNHYFEVMNSRGEQLEKHEIVKAKMLQVIGEGLTGEDADVTRSWFNRIWEACDEMSVYVQQNISADYSKKLFGRSLKEFIPNSFDEIKQITSDKNMEDTHSEKVSILKILESGNQNLGSENPNDVKDRKDSFQPIIDFSNFLLIVLKITKMDDPGFVPVDFLLDDKELINEFDKAKVDPKKFGYNLLKARFLLDNYVVHHSREDDTIENNPWKLQCWQMGSESKRGYLLNSFDSLDIHTKLIHLLSMFEVSFTARQRKNYLFYCLFYLMNNPITAEGYLRFVESLAERYFKQVYMNGDKLNAINTPLPGSFDETILKDNKFSEEPLSTHNKENFYEVYGDGIVASKGVPLFIFNYLDYKIWDLYADSLRGKQIQKGSGERAAFFEKLGCSDFELKLFDQFYFSRTRRSLEHYSPQANATGEGDNLNQDQINCLGNYAMIGSEANSSGSNWSPKTKLDHYLDSSGKISQISVASLKFMIMMQICKDAGEWNFEHIQKHQDIMVNLLLK